MKTTTLIQAQANVMKLTALTKGDTVKIIKEEYSSPEIYFGVVLDILNTGEKTYFQILKYKKSYGDIEASIETYSGEKDVSIFPATPDEVKENLSDCLKTMEKKVEEKKKELQKSIEAMQKTEQFVTGEMAKELKSASYVEVSQYEYDLQKTENQKKIDALQN